jgi:uncharacterized hydantoinase/oxoprolinase family protein
MDIATYVSNFPVNSRDAVVDQIIKGKLLKQAINTGVGKIIINSAIDDIHKKIMGMVALCNKSEIVENAELIRLATEVYTIYNLIQRWAQILVDADKHEKAMKK